VLDTELTTEQRSALELVRSSSEALLTILNDILDYSKIEAEHLELESIPFDLPKVVHGTATLLAVRAREKHLELTVDVPLGVPRLVQGDPTRLRQVLTNLIGNAIKFTEEGQVDVAVAMGAEPGEAGTAAVQFRVRDTGIGISAENQATIFGEFTQADASMSRRYGGTGLGLAISRRLVALMGGSLELASALGRGSEFHFTLPFPVVAAVELPSTGGLPTSLGGRRVLVVDDNETNRRILRDMLGAEGVMVHEASRAAEGLETLRRAAHAEAPYDLVILDVRMPDVDGFELAATIRADAALADTRLLVLTSAGERGDGERCRRLGIQAYLTKPITRGDLIEAVNAVLAGAPSAGGRAGVITRHSIAESRHALRILLAEDNPVNQQVATAMLVKRGHQVDVVDNGRAAVDAVQARAYDVVLMDIQMPEMDGFAATERIRALPQGRTIPVIALTAHALSGERDRCLAHGMSGYLAKPFKAHDLFSVVEGGPGSGPDASAARPIPVDVAAFRRTMREAGAEDAVDAIVGKFVETLPERLLALEAAAGESAHEPIERAAHALRSAAVTIAARPLAALLQEVEEAARAGDLARARLGLAPVRSEAEAVLTHLNTTTKGGAHA
jgi:CheY-like chemotaxis protein